MSTAIRSMPIAGFTSTWASRVRDSVATTHAPASPEQLEQLRAADAGALVQAFLNGSRDAFDIIVERHRRQVYQLCYRFLGNHEDASDLTQDVFVRAFKGLRNFKNESALSTWLYRVSVNACLNRVSTKRPEMEPIDASQHDAMICSFCASRVSQSTDGSLPVWAIPPSSSRRMARSTSK